MITFLSGGTGTPKLLQGVRMVIDDGDITVIVNTAEDMWYQGGHLSPDIDTVMYLFSGELNTDTWWGIRNDSFVTHTRLRELGTDSYLALGDRDRAVNIARAGMLSSGNLTEATERLCYGMGIRARILPMTDTPYTTMVNTGSSLMHFQEYWVKHRANIRINGVTREYKTLPRATVQVLDSIRRSEAVVIGPSNPITSILPILECDGIKEALYEKFVIAVSPFIGDNPVSGPARDLMIAKGFQPDSKGVCEVYRDIMDIFIQDIRDPVKVEGSVVCDTLMKDPTVSAGLFRTILDLVSKNSEC